MNKRVPYTIIPKYLKTINDLDNGANIKVVYWKLKCEENPSVYRGRGTPPYIGRRQQRQQVAIN